ncbi:hypothetical protein NL676_014395 [Syzygium grande]|nr:hypothetical protein NL676_014395 [Syzygium grande]
MSTPPPPQVVHIFSMEAVEEWKQLLELLSAGFPSLARDPERERTGLEAYKLNLAKIEEEAVLCEKAIVLEDRAAFVYFVVEWPCKMIALAEKHLAQVQREQARLGARLSRLEECTGAHWNSKQVRGLTKRLGDIGFEVATFGDFNVYLQGLLSSPAAKLESLEKECDHTFVMPCEMFPAAAQGEQKNSHMDGHLKDFVMAIKRQLDFFLIVTA